MATCHGSLSVAVPDQARRRPQVFNRYFAGPRRTEAFLLDYISDIELCRMIQAATNESAVFNLFVPWVGFGGRLLAENTRDAKED
jgi:hypothetical protein